FNEVTNMHVGVKHAVRADASERANEVTRADRRGVDDAVRMDLGIRLDATVFQITIRSNAHSIAEFDVADEHGIHIDENIFADCDFAANINSSRIGKRYAIDHQFTRTLGTQSTFE